jgi:hypothetical protein
MMHDRADHVPDGTIRALRNTVLLGRIRGGILRHSALLGQKGTESSTCKLASIVSPQNTHRPRLKPHITSELHMDLTEHDTALPRTPLSLEVGGVPLIRLKGVGLGEENIGPAVPGKAISAH